MDGGACDFISGRKILEPKLEKSEIENMRAGPEDESTGPRIA
jgi:hypothetical protein